MALFLSGSARATVRWLSIVAAAAFLPASTPEPRDFFSAADGNGDGFVTRDEFRGAVTRWALSGSRDVKQLESALNPLFPETLLTPMIAGRGPQNQTPKDADVEKMRAALPSSAPAKPARPRKVLVLSKCAGYVHACIPLAAKTIEELGARTGAYTATVTYDASAITASNLKQYDLLFLNNTTGPFLDDPDAAVTAARKNALLDFVRSGKGLAGIHAAGDSYHDAGPGSGGMGATIAPLVIAAADTNKDQKVDTAELGDFANAFFDRIDKQKTGKFAVADLRGSFLLPLYGYAASRGKLPSATQGKQGQDHQVGTWPEFNKLIGGFFKYHWMDPTHIVYKIDDPNSPLTAMFRAGPFSLDDETYTFSRNTWSRHNLHVLTSIDYSQMSDAEKRKEDYPREDHDYGLSWIRREGKGRIFYEAHGHNERVYANPAILAHLLAGIQYAIGDLPAKDTPDR